VSAFLGPASFYWRLIPKYIDIGKQMTQFSIRFNPFLWEQQQVAAFQTMKDALCSSDIMAYTDFTSMLILTTHASRVAVAALLSQVQNSIEMLRS
jgi:hypothetical protein